MIVPDPPTMIPFDVPAKDIEFKFALTLLLETEDQAPPEYFNNLPACPEAKAVVASTAQTASKVVILLFVAAAHLTPSYLIILPDFPTAQPLDVPLNEIALISVDNPLVVVDQVVPVLLSKTPVAPIAQLDDFDGAATPNKIDVVAFGATTVQAAGGIFIVNFTGVATLIQPLFEEIA